MTFVISFLSAGCNSRPENAEIEHSDEEELVVVGFSQVGSESYWRNVNSESMKSVFTRENGYRLIFEDAQQNRPQGKTPPAEGFQYEYRQHVIDGHNHRNHHGRDGQCRIAEDIADNRNAEQHEIAAKDGLNHGAPMAVVLVKEASQ